MDGLRSAASFEGLIVLGVIYLALSMFGRFRRAVTQRQEQLEMPPDAEVPPSGGTQAEGFSLEKVLREIERVKREAEAHQTSMPAPQRRPPPPARRLPTSATRKAPPARAPLPGSDRGPLGRHSAVALPSAEEVEDRTSLEEGGSRETDPRREEFDEIHRRRERVTVNADDQAEATVQRRMREAAARDLPHSAADHASFDVRIRQADATAGAVGRYSPAQLREAVVWREILGPPKSLEG